MKKIIDFDSEFLSDFSTKDWEATRLIYKEGKSLNDPKYLRKKKEADKSRITLNQEEFNKKLQKEVLWSIQKLDHILRLLLNIKEENIPDLRVYENTTLYEPVERLPEEILKILLQELKKSTNNSPKQKKK